MFDTIKFAGDYWLIAAIVLLAIIVLLLPVRRESVWGIFYPEIEKNTTNKSKAVVVPAILLACLILALLRPQLLGKEQIIEPEGKTFILAIDISKSMATRDMQVNGFLYDRLSALKKLTEEFFDQRAGDQIGLIVFGDDAYVQVPPTQDTNSLKQLLNETEIGFAGDSTAIGQAIALSVKQFEATEIARNEVKNRLAELKDKVVILLSDGRNTSGEISVEDAVGIAKKRGIKIYTIGFGNPNYSRDLDERGMQSIAQETNAEFFRARSPSELQSVYRKIDQLEKTDLEERKFIPVTERFDLPLGLGIMFGLLFFLFRLWKQMRSLF